MNLYDRLKPEVKEKIDNHEYDSIARSIFEELEIKKVEIDLTFNTVFNLYFILGENILEINVITLCSFFNKN